MFRFVVLIAFLIAGLLAGDVSVSAQAVSVTVTPARAALRPNATQQFTASVSGATDASVVWLVNGIRGGAPSIGVINATGLYTAPATVPATTKFRVEAASTAAPRSSGISTASVSASSDAGPSFYVATSGNDAGAGSVGAPWRTIQHAVDTVPAGATIFVRTGVYRELVTIRRSGSPTAGFISLKAPSGETPVIDGTGLGIAGGQLGLFTVSNASWIRIGGFELRNYKSTTTAVPVGIYVLGSGDHIELRGNRIHAIETDEATQNRNALGIAVYGTRSTAPISQLIIDGNEIFDLKTGFSESLSLSGNVTLWQVTGNAIHDNDNIGVNIEGFFRTAPQGFDQARDGLIANNEVYNISSKTNGAYRGSLGADGLYVDGGTSVTIQQNRIHDADIGIELASEVRRQVTSDVIVRSNLVYDSLVTGLSIGGAGAGNGGTANCVITNNTLFHNDTTRSGSGEFQIQRNASDNAFFNNILYANAQGLLVNSFVATPTTPASLDHNLYFSDAGDAGSQWRWLRTFYTGFAAFRSGSGQDASSAFANPQFVNQTTSDLRVRSSSPAVGFGVDLGLVREGLIDFGGGARVRGTAIDAGAYER